MILLFHPKINYASKLDIHVTLNFIQQYCVHSLLHVLAAGLYKKNVFLRIRNGNEFRWSGVVSCYESNYHSSNAIVIQCLRNGNYKATSYTLNDVTQNGYAQCPIDMHWKSLCHVVSGKTTISRS